MTKHLQGAAFCSRRRDDCRRRRRRQDEWAASFKSETITGGDHEVSRISRRYSASHATSFREEEEEENAAAIMINNNNKSSSSVSSKSNFTISSTVSSPGYNFKEETSYSLTTALRALQGRRLALNSKWNEAEKYISNPLSGEVPAECLSANTRLAGRSLRSSDDRLTTRRRLPVSMSAPLFYPAKPHNLMQHHPHQHHHLLLGIEADKNPAAAAITPNNIQKEKMGDERIGSAPKVLATCDHLIASGRTSSNSSPMSPEAPSSSTPSIIIHESSSSINTTTAKVQFDEEKREDMNGEPRKEEAAKITGKNELGEKGKQETAAEPEELRRRRPGGCLPWRRFLWMRKRERDKEKLGGPTKKKNCHCSRSIFLCPIHQC